MGRIKTVFQKLSKDNVGVLASIVSWSVLTSLVPIIVGLIAISGFFLFTGFALSGIATFVIGTAISLVAAFLLFASIYLVFPNVEPRFKLGNVWKGALTAAVIFEILTYIFPLYAHFAHFSSHGALLGAVALLMAWIYFFPITMLIGAEVVAFAAIGEARSSREAVGPEPEETVPQHAVLRDRSKQG